MSGGNKGDAMQVKLRGNILSHPVYATGGAMAAIQRGTMVMLNAAGFALQGDDASGGIFAGVSEEAVAAVAAGAVQGDENVRVRRKGIFKMTLEAAANAPTRVGALVYIAVAQGVLGGNDEKVDIAANVTNHVLVGKIVKHGTDAQAIANTSTADIWVDVLGTAMTVYDATYLSLVLAASHATGEGAELIGVEENVGWGATPTLQDALELMLGFGHIDIPLVAFTAGDGAPLTIQAGTEPGYTILSSKELTIDYPDDGAASDLMFGGIGIPQDLDETAGIEIHFLAEKSGNNNADLTFDLTAFMAGVGDSDNADIVDTTVITMTNSATTIEELVFSCNVDATNLLGPPASLNGIISVVTAGTDHVNIHAAWVEYTKKFA